MRITKLFLPVLIVILLGNSLYSQTSISNNSEKADTTKTETDKTDDFGLTKAKTPSEWMQKASFLLNDLFIKTVSGFDTTKWNNEFQELEDHSNIILSIILSAKEKNVSLEELYDLQSQANGINNKLSFYSEEIKRTANTVTNQFYLASLISDDNFNAITKNDSSIKSVYAGEYKELYEFSVILKTRFLEILKNIVLKEKRKNSLSVMILSIKAALSESIKEQQLKIISQDEPVLWSVFSKNYTSYNTTTYNTVTFMFNSIATYFTYSWYKNLHLKVLFLLIPILAILYLRKVKRSSKYKTYEDIPLTFINNYPVLISAITFISLTVLSLEYPPFIVSQLLLLTLMIIVSIILLKKYLEKKFWVYYLIVFVYYAIVKLNNFVTEVSIQERFLYFLSIIPIYILIRFLTTLNKNEGEKRKSVSFIVYFVLIHLIVGFVLNLMGRITLCKVMISGGINSGFLALFLFIIVYSAMDYVYLAGQFYNSLNTSFKIDLERIKDKILGLFGFFAFLLWVVAYLIDINSYSFITESLSSFFWESRKVGSIEFTFGTIGIFLFVLYLSFYISGLIKRIIEVNDVSDRKIERSSAGGYLLILRLIIISFGFLIALAASGLPLDKLTILISALGVGIGFGLQNIINNLVSGVIIAIEKPFRVGDVVNFGGTRGTVKEISIRSSIITTEDGSELIIPNGDLISKNLINWTSNNNFRKESILIEIESKMNDEKFKTLVNEALQSSDEIKSISGLSMNVASYSKGIQKWKINFWINDLSKTSIIRSEIVQLLYNKLTELEIEVITCE